MRPMDEYIPGDGYITYDLTEVKLNRVTDKDGSNPRLIARWPKKWTKAKKPNIFPTVSGDTMMMHAYVVTEWEEAEITLA